MIQPPKSAQDGHLLSCLKLPGKTHKFVGSKESELKSGTYKWCFLHLWKVT